MIRRGEQVGQTIRVLQCRFLLMNFAMILQVQGLGGKFLFSSFLFYLISTPCHLQPWRPPWYQLKSLGLQGLLFSKGRPIHRPPKWVGGLRIQLLQILTGIFVATIGEFANLQYFPANLHPIFSKNYKSPNQFKTSFSLLIFKQLSHELSVVQPPSNIMQKIDSLNDTS